MIDVLAAGVACLEKTNIQAEDLRTLRTGLFAQSFLVWSLTWSLVKVKPTDDGAGDRFSFGLVCLTS